ncbi:MAG: dockerin type I domain-containing protein [Gemmatimonadota bacterium]
MPSRILLRLLVIGLAAWLPASGGAQSVTVWDASRFEQPGQRSLFLREPNGGRNGLPLGGGDVNGDGRDDALLCAFNASEAWLFLSPPTIAGIREAVPTAGEVTRFFGVSTLGVECAAGDVNGDGLADLILGAPGAPGPAGPGAGAVFVVLGSPALAPEIDLTQPGSALSVHGTDPGDHLGVWVDAVDVDGDGIDDLLIGAPDADGPGNARREAGEAYVVFGGRDLTAAPLAIASLQASGRVFTVLGAQPDDATGSTVDAGRIDGGGVADLVVGAALNRAAIENYGGNVGGGDGPDESRPSAGEVAVIFDPTRGGMVDLAAPPADATIIFGVDRVDFAGEELDVGDADGDGFGDLLIGALTADGLNDIRLNVGEAYVVYGGPELRGRRLDLAEPTGSAPGVAVTTIYGPSTGGITGDAARFIDIDGDGRDDVFVGSPTGTFVGPDGRVRTGALFFVRSPAAPLPPVIDLDVPPVAMLPFGVVLAADPGDILSYSLVKLDADGDGVDDVLVNGMTGSGLGNRFPNAGEAYVIDGQTLAATLRPFASGDVTGEGATDVRDLQRVIAFLVGRGDLSAVAREQADTNGNGEVDEGDLPAIVDLVLGRNALAPGVGGGSARIKSSEVPDYRYQEPGGGEGDGGYGVAYDRSFALVARASSARAGTAALRVVRATFRLGRGGSAPELVAREGVALFSGRSGDRLTVVAMAREALPMGELFRLRGGPARIESVRAATAGGTPRLLRAEPRASSKRAMPPGVGLPSSKERAEGAS